MGRFLSATFTLLSVIGMTAAPTLAADSNNVSSFTGNGSTPGGTVAAPTSGDWNNANNWVPNAIPVSSANT